MFISKYLKAMEEDNGYDKLIVFPPPLNFLLLPLIATYPSRSLVKQFARITSRVWYWFSNVFVILAFYGYMISYDPVILCRIYYQIMTKIDGFFSKIYYLLGWTLFGWLYLLYINLNDTILLVKILCLEGSSKTDHGEEERLKQESLEYQITRNIIRAMKILHEIGERSQVVFQKRQSL